jgi:hypothetical protein
MATQEQADERTEKKVVPLEERLRSWFAHPLLVLLIGALITGILVPEFTHRWQAAETAQNTKTRVITDVSDAASTAMTQLEIDMNPVLNSGVAAMGGRLNSSHAIAGSYNNWTMKSTSVSSELIAYLPGNNIPDQWGSVASLIKNFFLLTYATDGGMRQAYISHIKGYFDFHKINIGVDWSALQPDTPWTDQYRANWSRLEHQIMNVKDRLIASIMDASPPSF